MALRSLDSLAWCLAQLHCTRVFKMTLHPHPLQLAGMWLGKVGGLL